MKQKYSKPQLTVEYFSLRRSIADDCGLIQPGLSTTGWNQSDLPCSYSSGDYGNIFTDSTHCEYYEDFEGWTMDDVNSILDINCYGYLSGGTGNMNS